MGPDRIEHLSSRSDLAHLDGSLCVPVFLDKVHLLVMEDGTALMLPNEVAIPVAGRFTVSAGGTYVDTRVDADDLTKLALWAERLALPDMVEALTAYAEKMLDSVADTSTYIREDI